MSKPRPSRAGRLASIQTTPAVARSFRREADRLGMDRAAFLAALLRGWWMLPKELQNTAIRK